MAVSVDDKKSVGEEARVGHGERGSVWVPLDGPLFS